jgi:4a-hydroxytetrahydrobiopterin dehydratase
MAAIADAEIMRRLAGELPDWRYHDHGIERTLKTGEWKATVMAANAIAFLAEAANHHPDLGVHYGRLDIRLTTHDAGGVTEQDYRLAVKIDALLRKD